ncbi:hypothetical protein ACUIJ3_06925 [Enterobacter cloacae]
MEPDYDEEPIHPSFVNDTAKKFARLTREHIIKELHEAGLSF